MDTSSYYINPNTRSLTSNKNKTAIKDKEALDFMFDRMRPVEDLITVLKTHINLAERTFVNKASNSINLAAGTRIRVNDGYVLTVKPQGVEVHGEEGYNPYDQDAYLKAQSMATALDTLLRNAGGTMKTVAHSKEGYERFTQDVTNVLGYMGIDTGKDFYVNGMKYSKNSQGYIESEANTQAKAAYEQLKANNRTYEFADERTRKQIAYMSDYYLVTVPEDVRAAWQAALEETGINPFPSGYCSVLQQLATEQDFLTGGNDNIFGNSLASSINAVNRILDRIANPLAAVTEENEVYLQREKEFYNSFMEKLKQLKQ
ncbi:MAG: hypothetical protein J1D87_04585 [Lachnospiraceae bacterium]|nr:hypothetical protein [Lachnospiraceae bacterium]